MAERFSPEYIQEVTTKMPHVQAQWDKRGVQAGDWAINKDRATRELIVLFKRQADDAWWGFSLLGRLTDWFRIERLFWVPRLSDLLDMLKSALDERCGYILSFNEDESDIGQMAYRCYQVTPLEWLGASDDTPYSDRELIVARLLERVLENKK